MNILDKIVAHKRTEIATAKAIKSRQELEKEKLFSKDTLSLKNSLRASTSPGIISEFKRQSPSKGIINDQVQPETVTAGYSAAGALGLSILTDISFFGGSFEDFGKARAANPTTPMLRKDFMVDEYQLFEAKAMGADVILLIAACLSPKEVKSLAKSAHNLGLEVLLEVHDREELNRSLCEHIDMVGVNNRNLKTFSTSVETSVELLDLIPDSFVRISESGLKDAETIVRLFEQGYQGFLIGETFMKATDPAASLAELQAAIHRISNHKPQII
jgi:indole-3-glycerol phosphate synthase